MKDLRERACVKAKVLSDKRAWSAIAWICLLTRSAVRERRGGGAAAGSVADGNVWEQCSWRYM